MVYQIQQYLFILLAITIPISIALTNYAIVGIVFCWLFSGKFKKKTQIIKRSKPTLALLLLIIFYTIGMFWGDNHADAIWVFQNLALLLLFPIFLSLKINQKTIKLAIICFLSTNFLAAILALFINFEIIHPLYHYLSIYIYPNLEIVRFCIIDDSHYMSAFTKYNYHNILLSFSCVLATYILLKEKIKKSIQVLLISLIIIYILSIATEAGRAGILYLIFSFVFFGALHIKKRPKIAITLFLITGAFLFSSYNYSQVFKTRVDHTIHVMKSYIDSDKDVYNVRFIFFTNTLEGIKNRPILGQGTGSWSSFQKKENLQNQKFKQNHKTPHNNYLYIWFELGIFGFVICIAFLYYQVKELIKLENGVYRIMLPFLLIGILMVDAYLFIFTIIVFYIYFYKICRSYFPRQ